MMSVTPALAALAGNQQAIQCKLYTLTMITGQNLYLTDADIDVVCAGQVYSSAGPSIKGAHFRKSRGLAVDTLTLQVLAGSNDLIGGVSWSIAARSGALDGTRVKIAKAFLSAWGSPAEAVSFFVGSVNEAKDGEQVVEISVVSDDAKLESVIPKLTFQPGCWRTLYDAGCSANRAAYQKNGAVTVASGRARFSSGLSAASAYFALGAITFTSGLNSGVRRSVKSFVGGEFVLSNPLVFDLAPGDSFVVVPGCDKTLGANGCAKFNNTVNFKGTPYVPKPETMV